MSDYARKDLSTQAKEAIVRQSLLLSNPALLTGLSRSPTTPSPPPSASRRPLPAPLTVRTRIPPARVLTAVNIIPGAAAGVNPDSNKSTTQEVFDKSRREKDHHTNDGPIDKVG